MPITDLAGKKCFVTGAASGIGRAVVLAAAGEGAELYLTDLQAEALEALVVEVRAAGGTVAEHRALDVSDYAQVRAWADELGARAGSMDVVMNIAGIATWGEIQNLEHRHWRRVVDVNLMGPIHVLECLGPAMIAAGRGGHIVNVSSAAGLFPLPWHAAYSASKFGLRGLSEVLRQDLRRHGIGVSLVCPGAVNTGLVRTVDVVGLDMTHPAAVAFKERFVRHAIAPEKAARAILAGIRENRFMVFTSLDIRIGYWLQRKLAWPVDVAMRVLNDQFHRLALVAGTAPATTDRSSRGSERT